MVTKAQKIRLGIFIAIGSLLLLIFAGAVAGSRLVEKRDFYYIAFADYSVSGLQVGGSVNFSGIKIGRVEEVKIDPDDVSKIIIKISVQSGTPIKEDAEAVLANVGITGLKAVEIRGGTNQAKTMKPGSFIKTGTSLFDDVTDKAVSIADKVDQIAANLADMTDEKNRENIAEILKQASLLLNETRENISSTISSINKIAENAVQISAVAGNNLTRITDNLTINVDKIADSTTKQIDDLSRTTQSNIGKLTDSATKNLDSISQNTNRSLDKLTDTATRSLETFTKSTTSSLDSITVVSTGSVKNLANTLTVELARLSENLNQSLANLNQQSTYLLQDTRYHINAIGTHSDKMIVETTKQIIEISTSVNKSLERINTLIQSPAFDDLVNNVSTLSAQLAEANLKTLVQELSSTVSKTGSLVSNIDRTISRSRSNLTETLESLRETAENLNEFSKQISDNPSLLLRGYQ
ncbi:MAG: MlaD family protein [Candidatus Cloacimonetes bacterium]|nr:MlaD family protein [Candidatus Cloacimonadota bacterium]